MVKAGLIEHKRKPWNLAVVQYHRGRLNDLVKTEEVNQNIIKMAKCNIQIAGATMFFFLLFFFLAKDKCVTTYHK